MPGRATNAAIARINIRLLTVKLRGRTTTPDKRRGRTLSSRARGAKPQALHGPLERLLDGILLVLRDFDRKVIFRFRHRDGNNVRESTCAKDALTKVVNRYLLEPNATCLKLHLRVWVRRPPRLVRRGLAFRDVPV